MKKITNFATILMMSTMLQSQILYVKPNAAGSGDSWADACNLETAVVSAPLNGRTEIWVQKGTYYPSKMLVVPDSVKIYGGFAGTETQLSQRLVAANPVIVDGQHKIGSIFRLGKSAELHGLTIRHGNANGNSQGNSHRNGGGVWADENCVIKNCIITNNAAAVNGGGIYAKGKVKIINCVVENNVANSSGNDLFGNCVMLGFKQSGASSGLDIAGCNPHIPDFGEVRFKTDKIWKITNHANNILQEWSDVVMADGCNKTSYYGGISGSYYSDCRANSDRSIYGDLFSWCAVVRFAHVLCPAPWRVPAIEDYSNLDKAFGGYGDGSGPGTVVTDIYGNQYTNTEIRDKYINTWGGICGGVCEISGTLALQDTGAFFWMQSEYNAERSFWMEYYKKRHIRPYGHHYKYLGFTLRCVK